MTISNELIKVLDDLGRRFGIIIDWSNKNVIPYLKTLVDRYIKWELATTIFYIVIGVILFIVGVIFTKYIWKHREDYDYFGDFDELETWGFVSSIGLMIVGVIVIFGNSYDIFKIIFLPELKIYEYIQYLIS